MINGRSLCAGKALLAVLCVAPMVSQAADWGAVTDLQAYALWDENPGLQQSSPAPAVAGVTDLRLRSFRRSETSEFNLDSAIRLQRYSGSASLFDQNVGNIGGSFQHNTERAAWGFTVGAVRDTTLTSELGTTGLNQLNLLHDSYRTGANFSWRPVQKLSLSASADAFYDLYADGAEHGLFDYKRQTARVIGSYAITERLQVGMVAAAARFASLGPFGASDTQNLMAQVRYAAGSLWSIGASGGPSRSNSVLGQDRGSEFSADLSRRSERGNIALSATRSVSTTGYGLLIQSEQLALQASRQMGERIAASATLSAVQTQQLFPGLGFTFSNVRYGRADTQLQWQFRRDWNLVLGAAFAQQHIQYATADQRGFSARLGLNWHRTYHGS